LEGLGREKARDGPAKRSKFQAWDAMPENEACNRKQKKQAYKQKTLHKGGLFVCMLGIFN